MVEKTKSILPKFVIDGWIIPDTDGFWGTDGAKVKPNAPQWAKDEYDQWKKMQEEARRTNTKL